MRSQTLDVFDIRHVNGKQVKEWMERAYPWFYVAILPSRICMGVYNEIDRLTNS